MNENKKEEAMTTSPSYEIENLHKNDNHNGDGKDM